MMQSMEHEVQLCQIDILARIHVQDEPMYHVLDEGPRAEACHDVVHELQGR